MDTHRNILLQVIIKFLTETEAQSTEIWHLQSTLAWILYFVLGILLLTRMRHEVIGFQDALVPLGIDKMSNNLHLFCKSHSM